MEKPTLNNEKLMENGQTKIYIGIAIIILSPLFGTLLYNIYIALVGGMISTDRAVEMFWFSCIFVMALLGIAIVFIGCNEIQYAK